MGEGMKGKGGEGGGGRKGKGPIFLENNVGNAVP